MAVWLGGRIVLLAMTLVGAVMVSRTGNLWWALLALPGTVLVVGTLVHDLLETARRD